MYFLTNTLKEYGTCNGKSNSIPQSLAPPKARGGVIAFGTPFHLAFGPSDTHQPPAGPRFSFSFSARFPSDCDSLSIAASSWACRSWSTFHSAKPFEISRCRLLSDKFAFTVHAEKGNDRHIELAAIHARHRLFAACLVQVALGTSPWC